MIRALTLAVLAATIAGAASAESVRGYYRKDGTYVQGHQRSERNGNPYDNYSTKGNVNPYTGQRGTHCPYGMNPC